MPLDDILSTAHDIVHGDRNDQYGDPIHDYTRVVEIFEVLTRIKITPEDGALFMLAVKLARLMSNHEINRTHRDSLVDAAGYLWVYGQIMEAQGKTGI